MKKRLCTKKDNIINSSEELRYKTILEPCLDLVKDFNKNIILLSDRYKGYNFLNKKNSKDLILPKKLIFIQCPRLITTLHIVKNISKYLKGQKKGFT